MTLHNFSVFSHFILAVAFAFGLALAFGHKGIVQVLGCAIIMRGTACAQKSVLFAFPFPFSFSFSLPPLKSVVACRAASDTSPTLLMDKVRVEKMLT